MAKLIGTNAARGNRSAEGCRARLRRAAPLTSAELISDGVHPEPLASLALRRVASGRIAKWGDHYFDWGRPTPSYLSGVFDELASTGLLAQAEQQDHPGLWMSLTPAGRLRYEQLRAMLLRVAPQELVPIKHLRDPIRRPGRPGQSCRDSGPWVSAVRLAGGRLSAGVQQPGGGPDALETGHVSAEHIVVAMAAEVQDGRVRGGTSHYRRVQRCLLRSRRASTATRPSRQHRARYKIDNSGIQQSFVTDQYSQRRRSGHCFVFPSPQGQFNAILKDYRIRAYHLISCSSRLRSPKLATP